MNREYPSTSCTEEAKHSQIPFMNASASLALPLGNWWQGLSWGCNVQSQEFSSYLASQCNDFIILFIHGVILII